MLWCSAGSGSRKRATVILPASKTRPPSLPGGHPLLGPGPRVLQHRWGQFLPACGSLPAQGSFTDRSDAEMVLVHRSRKGPTQLGQRLQSGLDALRRIQGQGACRDHDPTRTGNNGSLLRRDMQDGIARDRSAGRRPAPEFRISKMPAGELDRGSIALPHSGTVMRRESCWLAVCSLASGRRFSYIVITGHKLRWEKRGRDSR
jgi:hypothetical protein